MLPKIPYSMEKNKSMTVPIGNYNISSNFKPGDIADSYGISARRYPQLTNRRGREKMLYGEEVLDGEEILGMTVFQGEIVTVRETEPGEAAVYVGNERVVDVAHNKDIQLVAINSKLVIYPEKIYIEKIDGEWAWGALEAREVCRDVDFEKNHITLHVNGTEMLGYGLALSGNELKFLTEYTFGRHHNIAGFFDYVTKKTIVADVGEKRTGNMDATITKYDDEGEIEMPYGFKFSGSMTHVYVFIGSDLWLCRGEVKYYGYNKTIERYVIRAKFQEDLLSYIDSQKKYCNVYWVDEETTPSLFSGVEDGTWLQIGTHKDSFIRLGEYELIGSSYNDLLVLEDFFTNGITQLGWSLSDLSRLQIGMAVELPGYEDRTVKVTNAPYINPDALYGGASIVFSVENSTDLEVNIKDKSKLTYFSEPNLGVCKGDAVTISGCTETDNNISFVISRIVGKYIYASADIFEEGEESRITIERRIPDLDFICERDNRLYGVNNAEKTIYVSALGDPTNMYAYEGVSTDSFAVPVGGEGDFTGCCKYGESVLFFKEDKIYKLTGYTPADFAIDSYDVDGLQAGSDKSLVVINEVLYYKGKNGVFAYTGGIPTLISENFGEHVFSSAAAGTDGVSYYVSMSEGGKDCLLSYNTRLRLWVREGDERYYHFVRLSDGLYAADDQDAIYKLNASADMSDSEWMVQFVPFYETIEGKKTYSRLLVRAELPRGSYMIIEVRSDDGVWREAGKIVGANKGIIPIRLPIARCDKFELRLRGKGEFVLHEILREYHVGSEV